MIVRYDPGLRERIIQANWLWEDHDTDWDGIPNRMDPSPLGPEIRKGFTGGFYRGMEYDPMFYRGRRFR